MSTIPAATQCGVLRRTGLGSSINSHWKRGAAWDYNSTGRSREAALNWLALGLLLAAWNLSNDDPARPAQSRPASLRGYPIVSVRAASLHATQLGAAPMS